MKLGYKQKDAITGYAFILPVIVGFLILDVYPLIQSFYNSLYKWDGVSERTFIGLENYQWMLFTDKQVLASLKATGIYIVLHVSLVIITSLLIALLLNTKIRGMRLARTIMFTPIVTSTVAIAGIWLYIFNPNVGLINTVLQEWFGGETINWLGTPFRAMLVLQVVSLWKTVGYAMVFFLAGLQNIPEHLYEAAKIDGAGPKELFRHITLPLITPTIFFVLILIFINSAQEFELPLVLTGGGPRFTTSLVNLTIFKNAFQYGQMGYASAIAALTFLALLFGVILQWIAQRRWVFYLGE